MIDPKGGRTSQNVRVASDIQAQGATDSTRLDSTRLTWQDGMNSWLPWMLQVGAQGKDRGRGRTLQKDTGCQGICTRNFHAKSEVV